MNMDKLGVIVCGRVSAGNRLVASIVEQLGCSPVHIIHGVPDSAIDDRAKRRSCESARRLIDDHTDRDWIAIRPVRCEWIRLKSVERAAPLHDWMQYYPEEYLDDRITRFLSDESLLCYTISYDALVRDPMREWTAALPVTWPRPAAALTTVRDENAKYYSETQQ